MDASQPSRDAQIIPDIELTLAEDVMLSTDVAEMPVDHSIQPMDSETSRDGARDSSVSIDMDSTESDMLIARDAAAAQLDLAVAMDASVIPTIEDCFPEQLNSNLGALDFAAVPRTDGSEVCNESAAGELDGNLAQLGFSGGAPAIIDGQEVTACVRADFGRLCGLNEHVGVLVSSGMTGQACNMSTDNVTEQCDVETLCGQRPGASVLLFVSADSNDLRFVARAGQCGQGTALHSLTPLNAFSSVSDLAAVRYVYACRPRIDCGPEAADVSVDAMYLTWR